MEPREGRPQVAMEAVELAGIELTRILIGDGPEAQGAGQALGQRRGIERLRRYGRHLGLARADRVGALERDGGEHHQHDEEGDENLFHGARRWRDGARPARAPPDETSITLPCVIVRVDYGDVRYFRMARTVLGAGDLLDGRLSRRWAARDSGPPNLARDVRRLVGDLGVWQCVTTHTTKTTRATTDCWPGAQHHAAGPRLRRRTARGARVSTAALPSRGVGRPGHPFPSPRSRTARDAAFPVPGDLHARHATDHVALFEPERGWLFSAICIWPLGSATCAPTRTCTR